MESTFRKKVLGTAEPSHFRTPPSPATAGRASLPKAGRVTYPLHTAAQMVARVLAGVGSQLPPSLADGVRQTMADAARSGIAMSALETAISALPPEMQERARVGVQEGRWLFLLAEP